MKVLFVCWLNVSRSQMAEAILEKLSSGRIKAISAGVSTEENTPYGKALKEANPVTVECMREIGIDVSGKVSKPLTKEMLDSADIAISLIDKDALPEYLRCSKKLKRWHVGDPDAKTLEGKVIIRNKIYSRVKRLITESEKKQKMNQNSI